ncbi:MAG: signal peptidase I [Oscillibacter sp.]|jgi:signal peptidase I|nr:signal peptidase I [Oscillibacter sp.]
MNDSDESSALENRSGWYEWVQALVCAVLAVVLVFTFAVRIMRVDGPSMRETLQDRDLMLVVNSELNHSFERGDVVVLRKESFLNDPIVKRVIATAGQTVDIDFSTGSVFVDGELLEEDYIRELTYLSEGTQFPLTVPEGCVFVMGDNRNDSDDSRDDRLGVVDLRYVIGQAEFVVFPGQTADTGSRDFSRIGSIS